MQAVTIDNSKIIFSSILGEFSDACRVYNLRHGSDIIYRAVAMKFQHTWSLTSKKINPASIKYLFLYSPVLFPINSKAQPNDITSAQPCALKVRDLEPPGTGRKEKRARLGSPRFPEASQHKIN